jgi:hypothetical protein
MNIQINLDLRKRHPLGGDFAIACDACKKAYRAAKSLGPADPAKPGYTEHQRAYHQYLESAHQLHNLLIAVANMVGDEAASKISPLCWAMTVNFNGDLRPEAYLNFVACYEAQNKWGRPKYVTNAMNVTNVSAMNGGAK